MGTQELENIDSDIVDIRSVLSKNTPENGINYSQKNNGDEYYLLNLFKWKLVPYLVETKEKSGTVTSSDKSDLQNYPSFALSGKKSNEYTKSKLEILKQLDSGIINKKDEQIRKRQRIEYPNGNGSSFGAVVHHQYSNGTNKKYL